MPLKFTANLNSKTDKNENQFIVIEGLEGAGKTTAINTVVETLNQAGVTDIVFTREPGGTPLAEKLRELIKQGIAGDKVTIRLNC